jgi:hypothetical protein
MYPDRARLASQLRCPVAGRDPRGPRLRDGRSPERHAAGRRVRGEGRLAQGRSCARRHRPLDGADTHALWHCRPQPVARRSGPRASPSSRSLCAAFSTTIAVPPSPTCRRQSNSSRPAGARYAPQRAGLWHFSRRREKLRAAHPKVTTFLSKIFGPIPRAGVALAFASAHRRAPILLHRRGRIEEFKGQSFPEQSQASIMWNDIDVPLARELLNRWIVRFSGNPVARNDKALFRSLNMANEAGRIPALAASVFYDTGRSLALWVSAYENPCPSGRHGPIQLRHRLRGSGKREVARSKAFRRNPHGARRSKSSSPHGSAGRSTTFEMIFYTATMSTAQRYS